MNTRVALIQVGGSITISRANLEALKLETNAGAFSLTLAGDDNVTLSTQDKAHFERWRAILTAAGCQFRVEEPNRLVTESN